MVFGTIGFEQYKISCIIGINSEERVSLQTIYVDLRVEYDFSLPATEDAYEKTICYESLANTAKELAEKGKYRLIETFAFELVQTLMDKYKVTWACVRIKKPGGLASADYAVVELEGGKRS